MNKLDISGPWRFRLYRNEDVSGVSGTRYVADGIEFPDGGCVLRWRGEHVSTVIYSRIQDVEHAHGHAGRTRIVWLDTKPNAAQSRGLRDHDQDVFEGCLFASVGGKAVGVRPEKPVAPSYILSDECDDYLAGYFAGETE